MTKFFKLIANSKSGASAAEYALIVAVAGVTLRGGSFKTALTTSGTHLETSATNGAK